LKEPFLLKRFALAHFAVVLFFACSLAADADTLRGVVTNGTTNKRSAGDEVLLKRLGNGMEDAGKTTTNSKGEFTFNVESSQTPYLIWVKHQSVMYTHMVHPDSGVIEVQVFDAAPQISAIRILEYMMVMESQNDLLKVDEIFTVENSSTPPRTKSGQRTFEIYLPDGATVRDATGQIPQGMPLKAGLAPTGEKNQYAFAYPLRPGKTQLHAIYTLPYSGSFQFNPKFSYSINHMLLAVPESITLTPAGGAVYTATRDPQIKNVSLFIASDVTPQQQLGFAIKGTGLLPRNEAPGQSAAGQATAQGQADDTRPGGGLGVPNEQPDPLHSARWAFLGVMSLFLLGGAAYVYLSSPKPQPVPAKGPAQDRQATLLDAMKEEFFQLEADRLQGKISTQDYETAKAALDKTLQRAVQRKKSR
jgi:hypothetical protein